MRKAFITVIAIILLFGVPGCKSVPTVHEEVNIVDAANASNIAAAVNAYNALHISGTGSIIDSSTLEDAKEAIGTSLWPEGLSDEEAETAWNLVVIKDGDADVVPGAQEALQGVARDAYSIALVINAYNNLYPSRNLEYDITLEQAKEAFWFGLWPEGLSDREERAAWELIVIDDQTYVAYLTPEAQQALQESSGDKSNKAKIANAVMIAAAINVYNALNPTEMLPDNATLAEVKEALGGEKFWPSLLTDAEVNEAWKLIEIKDGVAIVKGGG